MRTPISNKHLPGYRGERVRAEGATEQQRKVVYDPDGKALGCIVYLRRSRAGRTEFGWAVPGGRTLYDQAGAVKRLIERVAADG